jgi:predicted Zn-dependent protease with MMP-like domain
MTAPIDFDALLQQFEDHLASEDARGARQLLPQLSAFHDADPIVIEYAEARLCWLEGGPEVAVSRLEQLIARTPEHADAHYDLGCIAGDRGDEETMVQHFLRVRALDARIDRELGIANETELTHIEEVAREALDRLPDMFTARLGHVAVMIELRPSRALVADGFDPRAFGLFEGPTDGVQDVPAPTRIVLFAANLLAEFPDPEELIEQIEVTVLHEVGHFFNLDEDELERLGLD